MKLSSILDICDFMFYFMRTYVSISTISET